MLKHFYFLLFFISGISGLIYESIWSHYLKLFLGHAAYSQTLVLIIYMGGMALGAWITGNKIKKAVNLLFFFALIELALGVSALGFHNLFTVYQNFSYYRLIPVLNSPLPVLFYKWLSASVIILPQSMLLGATFPLMAAGFIRRFPGTSGYKISILYFSNTLGASAGVLLSGFYLINRFGLKGALIFGGILDIIVGVCILLLHWRDKSANISENSAKKPASTQNFPDISIEHKKQYFKPLLIISGATAAASFMYEIGWIRMLSLVLGSSTHSFELMLSAFILGMALGSFFIRKRIDRIQNVPQALVIVQVIMGASAILSTLTYSKMFYFMKFIIESLAKNEQGYILFNLFSDIICMIIMLPSTICIGMVLPLIINIFYKHGYGEENIGKVYSINTFGSIAGVLVAVWVVMPLTSVRLLIAFGGIIDIAIGLYILYAFKDTSKSRLREFLPHTSAAFVAFAIAFGRIDPVLTASGVFRNGTIIKNKRVVYNKDGRTATVTLFRNNDNLVLTTNGKPDASVNVEGGVSGDEYTMSIAAILPLAITNCNSNAAVIGMGSGMTAHYLLLDSSVSSVDVIEIEPAMVNAARKIGKKVDNTFSDSRCKIYIDDAKTFFSTHRKKYDIIVSEPSNPWVSGVSSLFSHEFFLGIRNHLTENGILVQWFHKYESDISILVSIFKALENNFPYYHLYTAGSDLIMIAAKDSSVDLGFKRDVFKIKPIENSLEKLGFHSCDDLSILRLSKQKTFSQLINLYDIKPNSDYYPFVDQNAVKYRFSDGNIREIDTLREYIIPVRKIIESDTAYTPFKSRDSIADLYNFKEFTRAKQIYDEIIPGQTPGKSFDSPETIIFDYISLIPEHVSFETLHNTIIETLEKTLPYLSSSEMIKIWSTISSKIKNKEFSDYELLWIYYFEALCNYNFDALFKLSKALLPPNGPIEDYYINRMLFASFLVSSYCIDDITDFEDYYRRYESKDDPGIIIRLLLGINNIR